MTELSNLVKQLREASAAYYNGGRLLMDDDTFDAAVERLRELDPDHPFLSEIGAPPPTASTVVLPYKMPSLDKIKPGEDRLHRWLTAPAAANGFVMSAKLDGLSALWLPATRNLYLRGDGVTGQDISHLVPHIPDLAVAAAAAAAVVVRGELIIPRSTARELGTDIARSWVNGVIHRKEAAPTDLQKLRFWAYELLEPKGLTRSQQFQELQRLGYSTPVLGGGIHTSLTEQQLAAKLKEIREQHPCDTDGIVVAYNTIPQSESTPTKAKNPKDCVAFKMPLAEQSATTTVRSIDWGTSAQGYLIPTIRFDAVQIAGATIQACTGHNAKTVRDLGVGPGARIVVRRSGDVIPKLDAVLVAAATTPFPLEGSYEWDATGTHIRLVAGATPTSEVQTAKLGHFLKVLEIPGVGPATAAALVEGGLTGPAALWGATAAKLSELLGPKTGATLWENLRTALEKADEKRLFLASAQLPRGVGESKLNALFQVEPNPQRWAAATVGQAPAGWTAASLAAFLEEGMPSLESWRKRELHWIPYPKAATAAATTTPAAAAAGVICMTGFRDKALEERARAAGYEIAATLTGKVTLLLVADGEIKESEKVKAARAKGIPILKRGDFLRNK